MDAALATEEGAAESEGNRVAVSGNGRSGDGKFEKTSRRFGAAAGNPCFSNSRRDRACHEVPTGLAVSGNVICKAVCNTAGKAAGNGVANAATAGEGTGAEAMLARTVAELVRGVASEWALPLTSVLTSVLTSFPVTFVAPFLATNFKFGFKELSFERELTSLLAAL